MGYRPKFIITSHLLTMIEEIASFREQIISATIQVPWIPALQKDARARSTHSSTAIEGNPLTLEQVRLLEDGKTLPGQAERSTREVLNYFAGLRFIEKNAKKKLIAHQDILKLHSIIASGVMDQGTSGRYRDIGVRVGGFMPPPPEQVCGLMAELLEWWNKKASSWSPVISSAVLHYRFEEIHPFGDGNGRTGRSLALWELYRRGFDTHHIFSLDEFYWENRQTYYRSFDLVREQQGDLTGWLEFTSEALHLTLERVWLRVQHLRKKGGTEKLVLRPKQEQLLALLRESQSMSPQEIWKSLGISKQGAMDLLRPLIQAELVQRVGTKKTGKYILKGTD